MKVLVTGATGFLGQRVCADLIKEGFQVRGLGRNEQIGSQLQATGCEFVKGDLRNKESLLKTCEGIQMIVHSGALSAPWGPKKTFYDINVYGTQNVVEAAKEKGVQRLIHVSTPSVYFNFKDRFDVKETDAIAIPAPSLYTETKLLAEKIVLESFIKGDLETVIIRPRGIFGPGDTTLIPRLINAHDKGRLPIIGNDSTTLDITYVGNVSYSILLSLKTDNKKAMGEKYNITNGEPIRLWDTVEYILGRCGRKFQRKKVPFGLVFTIAYFSEIFCKYFLGGKEPTLTRYTAGLLAKSQTLNIEKAKRLLGYEPQMKMKEALEETIHWYLSEVGNAT